MTKNGKTPLDLLRAWVVERASDSAAEWFDEQLLKLEAAPTEKDFHLSLGYAPRRLGKADESRKALESFKRLEHDASELEKMRREQRKSAAAPGAGG